MTFTSHLAKLKRRGGVTYLSGITPSKRVTFALQLANKFFLDESKNARIYVHSSKGRLNTLNSKLKSFGYPVRFWNSEKDNHKLAPMPNLVWIEEASRKKIKELIKFYEGIPTIVSGAAEAKNGMELLVDSREQKPLFEGKQFKRHTLYVGDYTTEKLLDRFHIERKSPIDLYGTITKGHRRFRDEILKAEVNGIKLVLVVECKKSTFTSKQFPRGEKLALTGDHLGKIITTIESKYGLETVWCNSRKHARRYVRTRLREEEEKF